MTITNVCVKQLIIFLKVVTKESLKILIPVKCTTFFYLEEGNITQIYLKIPKNPLDLSLKIENAI